MGNKAILNLSLLDVRGRQAADPKTKVNVISLDHGANTILQFQSLSFPPGKPLELPAFPQACNLVCEVIPKRYRHCKTDILSLTDDEVRPYELRVLRDPKQWKARFTLWNQLPTQCEGLKAVLELSTIRIIDRDDTLGKFTADRYDGVTDGKIGLAKAALLNLFAKLMLTPEPIGGQHPWFTFVERLLAIGRERIYAIVNPEMGEILKRILQDIHQFDHYRRADASDHVTKLRANLPEFSVSDVGAHSVKTDERHANLQLTVAPAKDALGNKVLLLDADIDENGDLLNHLIDVTLLHPISGGTHPFDIHEYLLRSHRNLDLGYELD